MSSASRIGRAALLILLAGPRVASAAAVDSTAAFELIRANALPLRLQDDTLAGPGAARLMAEGSRSRFVLVGEDHGIAELPRFCTAYFHGLQRIGFHHVAIEVGPVTAQIIGDLAREKDPIAAFRRYDAAHPWSMPFVNWREEAAWVADVIRTSGGRSDALWGLDQEFLESPRIHFERLQALARTPQAKALAESCLTSARELYARSIAEKDLRAGWMLSVDDATFDRLVRAFGPPGSAGGRIVAELRASRGVYAHLLGGDGYANNLERTLLLKRHLGDYLRAARAAGETRPRVLFKFGAIHAMRGRTTVDTYDIGSATHELAEIEGGLAFNVFVQGSSGTQNGYRPYGGALADTAAKIAPVSSGLWSTGIDQVLRDQASNWLLIDLRPLRRELATQGSSGVPRAIERLAWSYDALLAIREVHASHLLN